MSKSVKQIKYTRNTTPRPTLLSSLEKISDPDWDDTHQVTLEEENQSRTLWINTLGGIQHYTNRIPSGSYYIEHFHDTESIQ